MITGPYWISLVLILSMLGIDGTIPAGSQDTGRVSGRVVTHDTGNAIAGVVITVKSLAAQTEVVAITDDDGRFSLVAVGDCVVTVAKTGYSLQHGVSGSNRTRVNVPPHVTTALTLRMSRTGVLAGTIRDSAGLPISGALVFALDARDENVRLLPWYQKDSTHVTAVTDRYGRYRLSQLAASTYLILAQPTLDPNATVLEKLSRAEVDKALSRLGRGLNNDPAASEPRRRQILAPVFYPGSALRSRAVAVPLEPGAEVDRLDFVLDAIDVYTIGGAVLGVEPDRMASLELALESIDSVMGLQTSTQPRLSLRPSTSGRFVYDSVPAGSYRVMARLGPKGPNDPDQVWFGTSLVSVADSSITDVNVTMRPAARVRGSVQVQGTNSVFPNLSSLRFRLIAAGSSPSIAFFKPPAPAAVQTDGAFDLGALAPGLYTLVWDMPAAMHRDWWFESAMANGREVLDVQLLVGEPDFTIRMVLTDISSGITGRVRGHDGTPANNLTVLLFSTEKMFWYADSRRVRMAQTATDGSYSLLQIPSGEYYLAVFREDSVPDRSVSALASVASLATRIRIEGGKVISRDLVVK